MKSRKLLPLVAVLIIASLVLAACPTPEPEVREVVVKETVVVTEEVVVKETVVVKEEVVVREEVVVAATPAPMAEVDRNGAWLDTVIIVEEPSADAAVSRMLVGDIDVYAFQVSNREVAARIAASDDIVGIRSSGSYNELSFNPVGPVFESTGKLNPFAIPAAREAMNWLIDRNYIVDEIYGGLGTARYTPFNTASGDYALMADVIRALEAKYAYNPALAEEVIGGVMEEIGATKGADGKWQYEGAPVEISVLIRTEDERRFIGDYVATQLENIGFTAIRDYKTAAEASPIWINGDPAAGLFHIYTGGWISTAVPRDLGSNFEFFYTPSGLASPLWQAYTPDPEYAEIAEKLANQLYTTVEERKELMAQALELSFLDSVRVWSNDRASVSPVRSEISVASDLYGAIAGTPLWATTMQRDGQVGGSVRVAMPSILTNPWNPVAGTNWIFDQMPIRGTGEFAVVNDPYTGLNLPNRIERAELFVEEGRPVGKTLDWVDLQFVPSIEVPGDAWADWDAENQVFITASEAYTQPVTVARKSVVYYPADLYDTVKWHDGSPYSVGDAVMRLILLFDRAKEASAIYDPAAVSGFNSFMASFRGVKIVSTDPLVIEFYSDSLFLDAEENIENIDALWPSYAQGQGSWHALTPGIRAEAAGETALSSSKADTLEVEYLSMIAGPTIAIMKAQLDAAQEEGFIPYEPTLGQFITAEEAEARYNNLAQWFNRRGHFWIGTGVFYLERAFPVEGTVILQRFVDHPDPADKWARFAAPPIAELDIDGPSRVTIGQPATFDVFVEFQGEPYAVGDILEVKYLLFDANGELAASGAAEAIEDGLWQVSLGADVTGQLAAGSNRLEVVVVSKLVAVPVFDSVVFVTAQ
jgi:peptide/nickel transport system substrate-binding protein